MMCPKIITSLHSIGSKDFDNIQSEDINKSIDEKDLIKIMINGGFNENTSAGGIHLIQTRTELKILIYEKFIKIIS